MTLKLPPKFSVKLLMPVMILLAFIFVAPQANSQIRITEYMYSGAGGEFVEFTNIGNTPIDMTGWSEDDITGNPGVHSLSAFGVVQPGESVILTETAPATFRSAWGLCATIKIIGPYTNDNLGRADEINLYDASNALVDRLTYDDQTLGGPRTQNKSAWVSAAGLGANQPAQWTLSAVSDGEGSFASSGGDIGSPGKSTRATVAFNPCTVVNGAPTIVINVATTTDYLDAGATVSPSSPFGVSGTTSTGTTSDATDPARVYGIDFTIGDDVTPAASLTVTASSSNTAVVPNANISLSGSGASRNLKITPAAVGYSNISVTVNDGTNNTTYVIVYAASAGADDPFTRWHTGISDASTAVALDDDYYIAADDELNVLNVYSRTNSGLPFKSYNYTSGLNLPDPAKPEVDVEASVKSPTVAGRIFWLGSMSNGKSPFESKPNRNRLFATSVTGTGAAASFSFDGYYGNLRASVIAWGDANGYDFSSSAAAGVDSKSPGGFAAEGMVFGPDNTTLYIGFRAPLVPTANRTKAVIAPILNFESWFNNGAPSGDPVFGAPIELSLGGRGIRELIKLSSGSYIIVAGSAGESPVTGALYKWTGIATDAPVQISAPAIESLNAEGAMQIGTSPITTIQVITDKGGDVLYNDGVSAKDLGDNNLKKFRSDIIPITDIVCNTLTVNAAGGSIVCAGQTAAVTVTATGGTAPYTGTGTFTVGAGSYTYTVTDANGCTGTASVTITQTDTVKPAIYFKHGDSLLTGITGPSSSQTPYLRPSVSGVKFTSILSVNDAVGGYRMVGIPDGLGAFDNGNGTFTLLMNHELVNTVGVTRAHGSKGAFVSKWVINKSDLSVVSGSDLMQRVYLWDTTTKTFNLGTSAFSRFCSADLPAVSAFYNSATGLGTTERIFMDGEESGTEGRALGHIATGPNAGTSYELPYLGKFSWENAVASPSASDKTVVAGMDDGTGGQVYFYIGSKTNTGSEIEKAGLHNGKVYGVVVAGFPVERVNVTTINPPPAPGTRFSLADLGHVQNMTGTVLNTNSNTLSVTSFSRPEDGAWDPTHPNDFYFNTTDQLDQVDDGIGAQVGRTRLWRLRFDDVFHPELGGTIEAMLDGTEKINMLDNMAIDKYGKITLVEDVGNAPHLGKVWQYNPATDSLIQIAKHDSARFGGIGLTPTAPFNQDEESSGVIDASEILGPGMYLVDVQAHYTPPTNATEAVEGGQLLAFFNPYAFGTSTAPDTVRVTLDSGSTATGVSLGTPATADNCGIASVTNDAPSAFPIGTTTVTWTVTDVNGNSTTATQIVIVSQKAKPVVTITSPVNGATYPAGTAIELKADASDPEGSIVRVVFYDHGVKFAEDSTAPYQFTGNEVAPAEYVLTAKAFNDHGDSAVSDTVRITVSGCNGTGSISAEGFFDIPGSQLVNLASSPKFPNNPDIKASLNKFEYGPNIGDNYGARVRGYICAPQTGNYVFYLSSDDQSELWLSTDDNIANVSRIAYVSSYTGFREWLATPSQRSVPIRLVKGVKYYIEAVHKENAGRDHLSVGWQLPNGAFEGPIAGSSLIPWETGGGGSFEEAMIKEGTGVGELTVKVRPNPSTGHFTISTQSNSQTLLTLVVVDVLGRVIENRTNVPANGTIELGTNYGKGVYFVKVIQGSEVRRLKLVKQ